MIYYAYSDYLKSKYHEKVYKLPINLPVSCPNRANGQSGCAFCAGVGTGFEAREASLSVSEQLALNHDHIAARYHAKKFIAYFQNYTNTFLPVEQFDAYLQEAAKFPDIVEISISTRPDCISREYLDVCQRIKEEYQVDINIELGLQTVNYHTLDFIHRGHGLAAFIAAVLLIHEYKDFTICAHVILNLPGDTVRDAKETAQVLSVLGVDIVKLHSLYIAKNTLLCDWYEDGRITLCSKEEYLERVCVFLENIPVTMAVERLFSRIPEDDAVFCNWGTSWWKLRDELYEKIEKEGRHQGAKYEALCSSGLRIPFDLKELEIC